MNDYKERIKNCIEYLNSGKFPCGDWKEDKIYFERLEEEFSEEANDNDTKQLLQELRSLIYNKRVQSLNMNKTTDELFSGWDD